MFLYPALLAGLAFVAVPLLVHLINRLRHQRQSWAAMDFLLASYRKQKNWILLKQLILLLTRTAIAALLVLLLAGWVAGGRWLNLVSSQTTHHLFVLDDSYSMGDRSGGQTAFDRGLDALRVLVEQLSITDGNHQLTVIRSSRAALITQAGSDSADAAADLSARSILGDASIINPLLASEASAVHTDLTAALELASQLLPATPADERLVYVASDFRQIDWQNAAGVSEAIGKLAQADGQIRMIDCGSDPVPNLAITSLQPLPDVWVAGVPVTVRVTVKNFSNTAATNVAVATNVIRYPASLTVTDPSQRTSGAVESLPALLFDELPAGSEQSKSFQVYVTEPGLHAVEAVLPDDALAVDNHRVCTLPLTDLQRVLVVDGDPSGQAAFAIRSVLDPGSQVRTGAVPDVQSPGFLLSLTADQLLMYRAVYLIDLPEISDTVAQRLSDYVQQGGGLFWFLGSQVQADSYNRSLYEPYRLLPAPLDQIAELGNPAGGVAGSTPARSGSAGPGSGLNISGDVLMGPPHELTAPLAPLGDGALALVGSLQSWSLGAAEETGEASDAATAGPMQTILQRRDGAPWVVEHALGQGRVVTALTSLDRRWTNWSTDPSFVVFMLQANAYLWSSAAAETSASLMQGLDVSLPEPEYVGDVSYLAPTTQPPRVPVQWTPSGSGPQRHLRISPLDAIIQGSNDVESLLVPGLGELQVTQADGATRVMPQALVIEAAESDLTRAANEEVRRAAEPVSIRFVTAGELAGQYDGNRSSATTTVLLTLLVLLLAIEQLVAYVASYHRQGLWDSVRETLPAWAVGDAASRLQSGRREPR